MTLWLRRFAILAPMGPPRRVILWLPMLVLVLVLPGWSCYRDRIAPAPQPWATILQTPSDATGRVRIARAANEYVVAAEVDRGICVFRLALEGSERSRLCIDATFLGLNPLRWDRFSLEEVSVHAGVIYVAGGLTAGEYGFVEQAAIVAIDDTGRRMLFEWFGTGHTEGDWRRGTYCIDQGARAGGSMVSSDGDLIVYGSRPDCGFLANVDQEVMRDFPPATEYSQMLVSLNGEPLVGTNFRSQPTSRFVFQQYEPETLLPGWSFSLTLPREYCQVVNANEVITSGIAVASDCEPTVAVIAPNHQVVWSRDLDLKNEFVPHAIDASRHFESVFVVGESAGRAYVVELDSAGNLMREFGLDGIEASAAQDVVAVDARRAVVVGTAQDGSRSSVFAQHVTTETDGERSSLGRDPVSPMSGAQ